MSSTLRGYPTVSRTVLLAPSPAAQAFDLLLLDPAIGTELIPAGPLRRDSPAGYGALRKLPAGLLVPGRWGRRLPVVLELLPWSERRSELFISTTARPWLNVESEVAAYLRVADRYLAGFAALLDSYRPRAERPARFPAGSLPPGRIPRPARPAEAGEAGRR